MINRMPEGGRASSKDLRRLSALFLVSALAFFPMTMNPLIFGFFDADSEAERIAHADDHLGALRLLFTGIGLTEVLLGGALWWWGVIVARQSVGRRRAVALWIGRLAAASGLVAFAMRLTAWSDDAEALASDELSATDIVFGVVAGGGLSLALIAHGYLMIRGAMPIWLGVVWIVCGVMFWLGILPLWFFVGALVFGVQGLIRFRPNSSAVDRVSANRPSQADTERSAPPTEVLR